MDSVKVDIIEVGLRDGLQNISVVMSTADKTRWLDAEAGCGVTHFEVGSFVPARLLPQMADTAAVIAHARSRSDLRLHALVPNAQGAAAAIAAGADILKVPVSVSAAHSLANVRRTPDEMVAEVARICALRDRADRPLAVEIGLATAFGCTIQGEVAEADVLRLAAACLNAGADGLALADTVGYANPEQVRRLFTRAKAVAGDKLHTAHFHDTRGLGLANALAAFEVGIRAFDASLGGLGGCPYAPGASGNVATEDMVFMFHSMGCETGIDLPELIEIRRLLAGLLPGHALNGKLAEAGLPKTFEARLHA